MKPINIQDQFLNQIRKENTYVTVFAERLSVAGPGERL